MCAYPRGRGYTYKRTRARVQHLEKQTVKDFLLTLFKQHLSALYLVLQK